MVPNLSRRNERNCAFHQLFTDVRTAVGICRSLGATTNANIFNTFVATVLSILNTLAAYRNFSAAPARAHPCCRVRLRPARWPCKGTIIA
jgi:hypothetical protein